jgi:hypothetical protein
MLQIVSAFAVFALVVPASAFAHHGWSSYDASKEINVSVQLQDVRWSNPHGSAKAVYNKQKWDVILAPVSRMEARGLTRAMLGKPVRLIGYPRSDGTREMRIERVVAAGKTIELR